MTASKQSCNETLTQSAKLEVESKKILKQKDFSDFSDFGAMKNPKIKKKSLKIQKSY